MAARTWFAISICLLIWFGYLKWFAPIPPAPSTTTTQTQTAPPSTASSANAPAQPATAGSAGTAAVVSTTGLFGQPIAATQIHTITTSKLEASLTNAGGKINQIKLPGYHQTIEKNSDLIAPISPENSTFTLATLFSDPQLSSFSRADYSPSVQDKTAKFTREENGIQVTKEYKFENDSYAVDATYKITFPASGKTDWGYLILPLEG